MTATHVPAAFINALAEEGTREELITWLQKEWDEGCELRKRLQLLINSIDYHRPEMKVPDGLEEAIKRAGEPL